MWQRAAVLGVTVLMWLAFLIAPQAAMAKRNPDIVHRGNYWSWTGPRSWVSAEGAYGIAVMGDRGARLDLGFSTILCASGASWDESVNNYFAAQRQQMVNSGKTLSNISTIVATGPNARRQTMSFTTGRARRGSAGFVVLDYDFTSYVSGVNYCYQRSQSNSSMRKAWRAKRGQLQRISNSLAYFGPGA